MLGHRLALSFVAERDGAIVGHVAFSECWVEGGEARVALLGPLAVSASHGREGIGGALVNEGATRMARAGMPRTVLLGDPAYYGRLGFRAETGIEPPYPLSDKWRTAWQSRGADGTPSPTGRLTVPEPWRRSELWSG